MDGRLLAFTGDGTWGDIAEQWKPSFSGLYSDRWDSSVGEFGFLLNVAHSELVGVSHGIQSDVYKKYDAASLKGAEAFVGADGKGTVWMPQGANLLMKEDQREREGIATSFQWKDNDGKFLLTTEYIRSEATLNWWENAATALPSAIKPCVQPVMAGAPSHRNGVAATCISTMYPSNPTITVKLIGLTSTVVAYSISKVATRSISSIAT
jgi:hypothetical protein